MSEFTDQDHWKALILYGLNQATYKIALGKTLLSLSDQGYTSVPWDVLSHEFLHQYLQRLASNEAMPQQSNPSRRTKMERIVAELQVDKLSLDQAVNEVGRTAFEDVINRFHNLGDDTSFQDKFYRTTFGHALELTDELHAVAASGRRELEEELNARWSLLEGAFTMSHERHEHYELANDLRLTYLANGHKRKSLTSNIPFLQGYQGNACFYCGEPMAPDDIHVDHVLPRQVVHHDEVWNLVLTHSLCNGLKSDRVVGEHFMHKLIARNENIMGSNHPWKARIASSLGSNPQARSRTLMKHYDQVKLILRDNYWGGSAFYNPESDPFYTRLITVLNNGSRR
jgi:5-methylcytosine-specific restriction endonuclease McrA